jgi:hypothetical protein
MAILLAETPRDDKAFPVCQAGTIQHEARAKTPSRSAAEPQPRRILSGSQEFRFLGFLDPS